MSTHITRTPGPRQRLLGGGSIADRKLAVALCIAQHGGPWEGDCEPCHAYEEVTRDGSAAAVARWLQHLATDDQAIPNLPPIAGGSGGNPDAPRIADGDIDDTLAFLIEASEAYCTANGAPPIAGGSGEEADQAKPDHARENAAAIAENLHAASRILQLLAAPRDDAEDAEFHQLATALDCEAPLDTDAMNQWLNEYGLSLEFHGSWSPGDAPKADGAYWCITTGGPAARIAIEFAPTGYPAECELQYQDWFRPWEPYPLTDEARDAVQFFAEWIQEFTPIAGGSGEEEPATHDFRVVVRENATEDRDWIVSAIDDADARERYGEGVDVDSRTIAIHHTSVRSVEHVPTPDCPGCWAKPIAGGSGDEEPNAVIVTIDLGDVSIGAPVTPDEATILNNPHHQEFESTWGRVVERTHLRLHITIDGQTHADLHFGDTTVSAPEFDPDMRPIGGGAIDLDPDCIGRTRCIEAKDGEHCRSHTDTATKGLLPGCHAAFCHCRPSDAGTEFAFEWREGQAALQPIAGASDTDGFHPDDIARDHIAAGIVEPEDVRACVHCHFSVLPWQLRCEACGSGSPFTPLKPIAGGSSEKQPPFFQCWPIAEYFAALPEEAWEQANGGYILAKDKDSPSPFIPCCVGAHLAYFLGTTPIPRTSTGFLPYHDFLDGADALADKLSITGEQLRYLLYAAGAGVDPFGRHEWPLPPAVVFANLLSIEKVPSLEEARRMCIEAIEAYGAQLRPIAGGSGEEEPIRTHFTVACNCTATSPSFDNPVDARQWAIDHIEQQHSRPEELLTMIDIHHPEEPGDRTIGASVPYPFVAPTDSSDEEPEEHIFTVDTVDRVDAYRSWSVSAPDSETIINDTGDANWNEVLKEYTEDLIHQEVTAIEHHPQGCDACENDPVSASPYFKWERTPEQLTPIGGGSGECGYGWTCREPVVEGERACTTHVAVIHLRRQIRKAGIPVPATDDLAELRAVLRDRPARIIVTELKPIAGGSGEDRERPCCVTPPGDGRVHYWSDHWQQVLHTYPAPPPKPSRRALKPIAGGSGEEPPTPCAYCPMPATHQVSKEASGKHRLYFLCHDHTLNQTLGNRVCRIDSPECLAAPDRGPCRYDGTCWYAHESPFCPLCGREPLSPTDHVFTVYAATTLVSARKYYVTATSESAIDADDFSEWELGTDDSEEIESQEITEIIHDEDCITCLQLKPIAGGSGEEPPPRLTTRQRKERRLTRRQDWAESRRRKQAAVVVDFRTKVDQLPPMGEPIKVGHHSERGHRAAIKRADRALQKLGEHGKMAERHEERAANLEHQLETSIYDDDPDAIAQLKARITQLEARRTRIKAINAHIRKGKTKDGTIPEGALDALRLTDEEREDLVRATRFSTRLGFPPYVLHNLGGNIRRQQQRLTRLQKERGNA